MAFFGLLGGGEDQQAAAPEMSLSQAYGIPQNLIDQQRFAALGNIGAKLLAAAQAGPVGQRGQILAQMGDAGSDFTRGLMNTAQLRLYGQQLAKSQQEMAQNAQLTQGLTHLLGGQPSAAAPAGPTAVAPAAGGAPAGVGGPMALGQPGTGGAPMPAAGGAPAGRLPPGVTPEMVPFLLAQAGRDPQGVAKELYDRSKTIADRDSWRPMTPAEKQQRGLPDNYAVDINQKTGETRYQEVKQPDDAFKSKLAQGGGEAYLKQREEAASAKEGLYINSHLQGLVNQGLITGATAEQRLTGAKYLTALGLAGPELQQAVSSTEAYQAAIGKQVMEIARQLGANPSNADREFAQKVSAGQISLDEGSIKRILQQNDQLNRAKIDRFNSTASAVVKNLPANQQHLVPIVGPISDVPPPYQQPQQPQGYSAPGQQGQPQQGQQPQATRVISRGTLNGKSYAKIARPDGSTAWVEDTGR